MTKEPRPKYTAKFPAKLYVTPDHWGGETQYLTLRQVEKLAYELSRNIADCEPFDLAREFTHQFAVYDGYHVNDPNPDRYGRYGYLIKRDGSKYSLIQKYDSSQDCEEIKPRPRGKPKGSTKPEEETRSIDRRIRWTKAEFDTVKVVAADIGEDISHFVRTAALDRCKTIAEFGSPQPDPSTLPHFGKLFPEDDGNPTE